MPTRNDFRRLFTDGFSESRQWLDWFLTRVYRDEDLVCLEEGGKPVSGLLLTPYICDFHGAPLPMGYISCVATARDERGKGYMARTMRMALARAADRDMAICSLIPANRRLFFTYDSLGFSTIYYIDEQRYTSLHSFRPAGGFSAVEPGYDMLAMLERAHGGAVLHTRGQYECILADLAMDGGRVLACTDSAAESAMAFVTVSDECATVKYLPATSPEAAEAVLAMVRESAPGLCIVVWGAPVAESRSLRSRGMARIVNAQLVLSTLATSYPAIDQTIRLHDNLIAANNGVYILRHGNCDKVSDTMRRITLDVDISVLTRILASTPAIGDVFGLPATRPTLQLMLD